MIKHRYYKFIFFVKQNKQKLKIYIPEYLIIMSSSSDRSSTFLGMHYPSFMAGIAVYCTSKCIYAGYKRYTRKSIKVDDKEKTKKVYIYDKEEPSAFSSIFSEDYDIYKRAFTYLRGLNDDEPVDIYIKTMGGRALWCTSICNIIKRRSGKVRVVVDGHAFSAGSIIALAADEIYFINKHCIMSAIDTQFSNLGYMLQGSIKRVSKILEGCIRKNIGADCRGIDNYYSDSTREILNDRYSDEIKDNIMKTMYIDPVTHECLFTYEKLIEMGIEIQLIEEKDFNSKTFHLPFARSELEITENIVIGSTGLENGIEMEVVENIVIDSTGLENGIEMEVVENIVIDSTGLENGIEMEVDESENDNMEVMDEVLP